MALKDIDPNVDLYDLAMEVLRSAENGWSVRSWFSERGYRSGRGDKDSNLLAEAWNYLFCEGYVARDYTQDDGFVLTRRGRAALKGHPVGA